MNVIRARFGHRVLLPVVHCVTNAQAHEACEVAFANGADGVFLINQGGLPFGRVAQLAGLVLEAHPEKLVGINLLGYSHLVGGYAAHHALGAVWSDRCDVPASGIDDEGVERSWLVFGGVAFKYQEDVLDVGAAAREAVAGGVGVVTTSGSRTGWPPTLEKIQLIRAAIGDHALGVASGITPINVNVFLPYVDAFLVATGIEESFGVFDGAKVRALADLIHGAS